MQSAAKLPPLAEVLVKIYFRELEKIEPKTYGWENLEPAFQAQHLSAMTEVVRTLGLLGMNVSLVEVDGHLKLRVYQPKIERKDVVREVQKGSLNDYTSVRSMGYTGDPCGTCGSARTIRTGACVVCESCGSTSSCS